MSIASSTVKYFIKIGYKKNTKKRRYVSCTYYYYEIQYTPAPTRIRHQEFFISCLFPRYSRFSSFLYLTRVILECVLWPDSVGKRCLILKENSWARLGHKNEWVSLFYIPVSFLFICVAIHLETVSSEDNSRLSFSSSTHSSYRATTLVLNPLNLNPHFWNHCLKLFQLSPDCVGNVLSYIQTLYVARNSFQRV